MLEASEVPDLGDEADGRDQRDAAQRLQCVDDRRPAPRGRELPALVGEALDAAFGFVDRVAVLLEGDVLRGQRETEVSEPAAIRARPPARPGYRRPWRSKNAFNRCLAWVLRPTASSRTRTSHAGLHHRAWECRSR